MVNIHLLPEVSSFLLEFEFPGSPHPLTSLDRSKIGKQR